MFDEKSRKLMNLLNERVEAATKIKLLSETNMLNKFGKHITALYRPVIFYTYYLTFVQHKWKEKVFEFAFMYQKL